jgi:hypothetical protein
MNVKIKNYKDAEVSVQFQDGLPENINETIETLVNAVAGEAVMSQESAVRRNPMIENPDGELETMKKEREENEPDEGIPPVPESFV